MVVLDTAPLMYPTTFFAASKCSSLAQGMNLDNTLTGNKMSGFVDVRYIRHPTKLLKCASSTLSALSSLLSIYFWFIAVFIILRSSSWNLFRIFFAYSLGQIKISLFHCSLPFCSIVASSKLSGSHSYIADFCIASLVDVRKQPCPRTGVSSTLSLTSSATICFFFESLRHHFSSSVKCIPLLLRIFPVLGWKIL